MAQAASRSRMLIILAGLAAGAVLLAILSTLDFSKEEQAVEIGQIVLPQFEADVSRADRISVATAEESYSLTRDAEDWFMEEKGRYPINRAMLADLSEALAAMTYSREMTTDPRKFDQLGLGDPKTGGAGALLTVKDAGGAKIVDLIVGFKNGDVFVRRPDETKAWAVSTTPFPPLQRAARWLDLDVFDLDPANISEVEIETGDDPVYTLVAKPDAPGEFILAPPYQDLELIADYAPNAPGTALADFAPLDVVAMDALRGSRAGGYHVYTHDGLVIHAEVFVGENGRFWMAFSEGIEAETPDAQEKLDAIETRVAGWAFEISRLDYGIFQMRLSELIADPAALEGLD